MCGLLQTDLQYVSLTSVTTDQHYLKGNKQKIILATNSHNIHMRINFNVTDSLTLNDHQ